ncbi:MAG: hypothetical protein HQ596_07640 [Candidatus Saganbacteria bacterium]|nr:hypothetical protein [Candidatus Saganbacteria bacterium]
MKKIAVFLCCCVAVFLCFCVSMAPMFSTRADAMAGPAPDSEKVVVEEVVVVETAGAFLIDNFESGSLKYPREWWIFEIEEGEVVSNSGLTGGDPKVAAEVGSYSLLLKGPATDWYAGGCGTYLAQPKVNLSQYNTYQLDIYGNGPGSGSIKIEIIDDDNNNWEVEQDPANNYVPIYDDRIIYDVRVDWNGWQRVSIPLDDFVDDNPGVGDDIWNPEQIGGSGGFLQTQFICIAPKGDGSVNYNVDNIMLITEE